MNKLTKSIRASELAAHLGLEWRGADLAINCVKPLSAIQDGGLCFSKAELQMPIDTAAVVIAPGGEPGERACLLISQTPRLDFARALAILSESPGFVGYPGLPEIHPTARIGEFVSIGSGVMIGAGTRIHPHVVIGDGVRIGERCVIKSGTVIGQDGFGFERDAEGHPIRLVHLGTVIIGDDVELGCLNTVCRGTIGDTVLENHVKTDDHVHIAHNCVIRTCALITACAELSGGVEVGAYAWIGPNASVIQKVKIGSRAFVGIGAVVTKDVESGVTVAGNPARALRSL
jgi:UDP-3-O-[3-hydroxymyristoyl] glucosamine N-acyltransferase